MLSPYLKRILIDVLLVVALILGGLYVVEIFVDFLISLFHFEGTVNVSSIVYCVQRVLVILLPLVLLTAVNRLLKLKILQVVFFAIGICYLLANTWIINYMFTNNPMDLLYGSIPKWFYHGELGRTAQAAWENLVTFQYDKAMVFNYLVWDSYDLWALIFSTLIGIMYIRLGLVLDMGRSKVLKRYLWINILLLVLPFIYNMLIRQRWMVSGTWATRNVFLVFEAFFVYAALVMAATSRTFWHDVLW